MSDAFPWHPESRRLLRPGLDEHLEQLAASSTEIGEEHREAGKVLAEWIARPLEPGQPRHLIVVCTGNSRRSILGSTMGNLAAAFSGLPHVHFHSGGTDPTAFNPRTIATLRRIGVEIEPTGKSAPRGEPQTANPEYRIRWGDSSMEAVEFSKRYDDPSNPAEGFAALMVCDEADAGCPVVSGAALRLSMPFADPKAFDGTDEEAARYDERRDEIGRLLVWVMDQARRRLAQSPSA